MLFLLLVAWAIIILCLQNRIPNGYWQDSLKILAKFPKFFSLALLNQTVSCCVGENA